MLDELADFEIGGGLDDDAGILSGNSEDLEAFGNININSGFGDLNADNLPSFFKNPTQLEQENYDMLDSVANQTLDEDEEDNIGTSSRGNSWDCCRRIDLFINTCISCSVCSSSSRS